MSGAAPAPEAPGLAALIPVLMEALRPLIAAAVRDAMAALGAVAPPPPQQRSAGGGPGRAPQKTTATKRPREQQPGLIEDGDTEMTLTINDYLFNVDFRIFGFYE